MNPRRAAFLDRDGTIIEDVNYIARAEDVRVLPRAAEAIRMLNESGVLVVVITNQSGIARGLVTPAQYESVSRRIDAMLAADGARVDATYCCPHYPDVSGPCDCRKPGTLLYDRAIADLDLDASASMFVGDRPRDVIPAAKYGGSAYLICPTLGVPVDATLQSGATVVRSLFEGVQQYLRVSASTG